MAQVRQLTIPINRVEGDLEVRLRVEHGTVVDAWSCGTLYRGFEKIMVGRQALDGLVITPRICGICSTAHLTAAALALDAIAGVEPPPDAVRIRNLTLMAELLQNDLRHTFLTFMVDFCNPAYRNLPLYEEAVRRFQPLQGSTVKAVLEVTRRILEIVAIFGGQWPHSSYMVPGGITTVPSQSDLLQCRHLAAHFRRWYEDRVLGCGLERWSEVRSAADLDAWLEEDERHRDGELGFLIRFGRAAGLDQIGRGEDSFLSFGALPIPEDSSVRPADGAGKAALIPAGLRRDGHFLPFDPARVTEHAAWSWAAEYPGGRHPFEGLTEPQTSRKSEKYSWAKAPRYDGRPAETGPLAELVVAGRPLFTDLLERAGANALTRQLARLLRPAELLPVMEVWLNEISTERPCYVPVFEPFHGEGCGLTHGARGALGHWVKIVDNTIRHYQIITPTTWNASPRDSLGVGGPWEQALVGTPMPDPENPIAVGHVIRSFDACLVCTVHTIVG
ncbi:MAG: Ni,Fe-hydrogenase I large subunit [Syntrophobacteraceae bacterium CG2_30_61_12]|nr:MAG: Ni,Fe-hydrogenase I large subunit [Syntrophobacteraceae bacterium CG2_30_61_12]